MYKIAVLGDRDSVIGFKALGLDVWSAPSDNKLSELFTQIVNSEYAIIYVTEQYATLLSHEIERFKDSPTPAIICIPGTGGSLGLGMKALQSSVERAIGANIL